MSMKSIEDHAGELRRSCLQLVPYSFPKAAIEEDYCLTPLKHRQFVVDGYDISVHMNICDNDKYFSENIQIQGVFTPFLPFYVVCKVARIFLGSDNLSYTDFVRNNRKIYCWTLRRKGNRVLKATSNSTPGHYEDFSYSILNPGQANLFSSDST